MARIMCNDWSYLDQSSNRVWFTKFRTAYLLVDRGKADNISNIDFLKNSIFINGFPINDFWCSTPSKYENKLDQG